jgi:GR25 family glycosyltransferase involved in LPS biosynthesis
MENIINNYSISIITLVRNNIHYLKDSIGSILNQTNPNWESIIINDGSIKQITYLDFLTQKQISLYKNKIKIINLKEWKGLIKCHKLGIINSTKQIVGILDADDKLDETTVEKVLSVYNNSPDPNIFVYTNFYYCDQNLSIKNKGYARPIKTKLLNDRCGNHFRTFVRKYYFLTSGYDDDLIFGAEDQDILFKLEEFCKPIYIDECLYFYRTYDSNNITSSISCLGKTSRFSYYLCILKNIYSRYKNLNMELKIYNVKEHNDYLQDNRLYKESVKCNDVKYFFQLQSNGINLITLFDTDIDNKYFKIYKETGQEKFNVNINWDYQANTFKIVENNFFDLKKFTLIHPNIYFNEIYIINLKHEETKKERIIRIFDKYNIKCNFIEAVYGYAPEYEESFEKTKLKNKGIYGYSLSMIKILKDAIEKGHNKILVCDDDIVLHKNFDTKFDEYIKLIPFSWKVLFLGLSGPWSFNSNTFLYHFNFDNKFTTNLIGCDGSFCVGYDKSMFTSIIEQIQKFELPFDTQLIKHLNKNLSIEKYAFYPQIVIADTLKKSTIVNYEEEIDVMKNFERNHLRFMVNINEFDIDSMENNKYYNELKLNDNSVPF